MAQRFIAMDWDQQQLHVVAATISGGTVRFQKAIAFQETTTPNPAEAEQQGKLLRERLKAAGIGSAPVLVCLGRDRVILKEVRYPNVPAHEEAAIIRFQASKELNDAPDDVVLDFTPLGVTPTGEKKAQVVIVRREVVQAWQTLCQAAGLKLAALTPRAFGMAACVKKLLGTSTPPPEPADAPVALISVGERWAEFCVVQGDGLKQTRTLTVGAGLGGEIRRNLAVYAGQSPQQTVAAVYLALSGDQAALREKLVETLAIPLHLLDPFGGADAPELPTSGRGTFIGAIGLLHLQAEKGELPINFANVKQARAPRDPNSRAYVLAALLLLVLLGGGFVVAQDSISKYREELEEKEQELVDLDRQLAQEKDKTTRMLALHEWEGVPWPDELYELAARMPRITETFKVKSVDGTILKPPAKPRSTGIASSTQKKNGVSLADLNARPVARLQLKLDAPDDNPLNTLTAELLQETGKQGAYYRPEPHTISRGVYQKDILIRKRPPQEYTRRVFPGGEQ